MIPTNIHIKEIVTLLNTLPKEKEYETEAIKIARGKNELPTTWRGMFKKIKMLING